MTWRPSGRFLKVCAAYNPGVFPQYGMALWPEKIRPELINRLENAGTALLLEDEVRKPLFFFTAPSKVCAAFVHGGCAASYVFLK